MPAPRDGNFVPAIQGVSSADYLTPVNIAVNPITHAMLIDGSSLYPVLDERYVKLGNSAAFNAYIWPNADGSLGDVLTTDGDGNLSWAAGGGGGTISGTIAENQIAFGAGADEIEGSANLTFDGTTLNIDADMRFANAELLLFRGATDVNPGIIYVDGSNNFNINTESLNYPLFIDASTVNIANNAGTGQVNIGASGARALFSSTAIVFNETGADRDFRVEGDNDTHLLYVDGGIGFVGINESTHDSWAKLIVNGGTRFNDDFRFQKGSGDQYVTRMGGTGFNLVFQAKGDMLTLYGAGGIVLNEGGDADNDFRAEGDTDANVLFLDASSDTVAIRQAPRIDSQADTGAITPAYASYDVIHRTAQDQTVTLNLPTNLPLGATTTLRLSMANTETFTPNGSYLFAENNAAPASLEGGYIYEFIISRGPNDDYLISWTRYDT